MSDDRKAIEAEIVRWLYGLADHADDGTEHDTLHMIAGMIENGEYIEPPMPPVAPFTPPDADADLPF